MASSRPGQDAKDSNAQPEESPFHQSPILPEPEPIALFGPIGAVPPIEPPSMLLMEAGRIAGFDGRAGWPDALTLKELAALQYPDDKPRQEDLAMIFTSMTYRGEVQAVTVMRPIQPWSVFTDENKPVHQYAETGMERGAVLAFLKAAFKNSNEKPSALVRAWLGDEQQTQEHNQQKTPEAIQPGDEPHLSSPAEIAKLHATLKQFSTSPTKETAEKFGVSEGWVRKCVRVEKAKPKSGISAMAKQLSQPAKTRQPKS